MCDPRSRPAAARKFAIQAAAAVAKLFNTSCGSPQPPASAATTTAGQPNGTHGTIDSSAGAAAAAGRPDLHLLSAQFCQEVASAGSPPQ